MKKRILSILKTKEGKLVIGQKPNLPIIFAGFFFFLRFIRPLNILSEIGFLFFLAVWALWEITDGVNLWRRFLGIIVLLYLILKLLN